jgi:MoxR-like ATPase
MDYPFYTYTPHLANCQKEPVELPPSPQPIQTSAEGSQPDPDYLPDQGLVDAVNTALLLGQPLLLTGEPGTGKTQLAYHLACQLGYKVLKFETKSTSQASDLFYTYDALGRFHATQLKEEKKRTPDYITYNALGLAIILANEEQQVEQVIPSDFEKNLKHLFGEDSTFHQPQRTIVLIDEIDKAPRDFPNDILNEVEKTYFHIPELGPLGNNIIQAPAHLKPILILTSNSEKPLPNAFLRRCIYYHIPFPDPQRLRAIVGIRLAKYADIKNFLEDALNLFFRLRGGNLRKQPSTAELLNWLLILREMFKGVANPLVQAPESISRTLSALVKTVDDHQAAQHVLEQWQKEKKQHN